MNRPVALGKENRSGGGEDDDENTYHDDAIMGKAITNFIRKGKLKQITVAPQ
jgi:hypothetical protein